ncbi:hypothetical protein D3C87_1281000 [compost metagenome]
MHPATFGIVQTTVRQADPRQRLGLGLVDQVQQVRRKRLGQLRLTLAFLGVERQLQHAAIVPIRAALQVFELASGVTETADDHLRQRGAVSG